MKIFQGFIIFNVFAIFWSFINLGRRIDDLIPDNFLSSTTPFLRMICKQSFLPDNPSSDQFIKFWLSILRSSAMAVDCR